MKILSSMGGGLAGAVALTLLHEVNRKYNSEAPRMDLLGMSALAKILRSTGNRVPDDKRLYKQAMAGDILTNLVFYSIAGLGKNRSVWQKGALLGIAAGISALVLPGPLGLDEDHSAKTNKTKATTVALYLIGGLVASAVIAAFNKKKNRNIYEK